MCRYVGLDILAKSRAAASSTTQEVTLTAITA
jgi:hypothetical protein